MNRPIARRGAPSLARSIRVQLRVLYALIVREGIAKFGHENLGFFWVMAEPLIFAGAVMLLWRLTNHGQVETVGIVLFVLTGYCTMQLWRHIVAKSVKALNSRAGLLYHANVKPLDLILAIGILEVLGIFAAFMAAYIPLMLFDVVHPIHDPFMVVSGFLLFGWFAIAFGLNMAALSERFELLEKFLQAVMYITIPLTGVFTLVEWLPQTAQRVMLYSPLVNAVEMFRSGVMPPDVIVHYDAGYLIGCCVALSVSGVLLMKNVQEHLEI